MSMQSAKAMVDRFVHHAPDALVELRRAAQNGVGHLDDMLADLRSDIGRCPFSALGWSAEIVKERSYIAGIFSMFSDDWPKSSELVNALLNN